MENTVTFSEILCAQPGNCTISCFVFTERSKTDGRTRWVMSTNLQIMLLVRIMKSGVGISDVRMSEMKPEIL